MKSKIIPLNEINLTDDFVQIRREKVILDEERLEEAHKSLWLRLYHKIF